MQDGVTGFSFYNYTADDFWQTLQRAIFIYRVDPKVWRRIQFNAMSADFSWQRSALGYQQLYEWAIARTFS